MLLEEKGASAKAIELRRWMSGLSSTYEDRVLPIDTTISALSGQPEAGAIAGHSPGMADAHIGGTSKAHNLTVITLNLPHFERFGINLMSVPT
ncbi:type II toxin-antitoxin system VapC family toxin [Agrobacterium tumefaciens]|uniref:type II toxin-antitoxin system VapC family toxin n=1 Tax=Agrobacterium tumefaciens TaxID=358 RepID=UPI00224459C4|nr:type II toxin-antitoxin system VapC family toxin [Agrobacterium tumefaciens]MCW8060565.1 type II toxin-antitoxin system VapC family toxin [Agrobacterium tumefaciens]MCW8146008.1 type II toxin-antitoxin system VapC family toxin [Agrobacterium tumefaciens]